MSSRFHLSVSCLGNVNVQLVFQRWDWQLLKEYRGILTQTQKTLCLNYAQRSKSPGQTSASLAFPSVGWYTAKQSKLCTVFSRVYTFSYIYTNTNSDQSLIQFHILWIWRIVFCPLQTQLYYLEQGDLEQLTTEEVKSKHEYYWNSTNNRKPVLGCIKVCPEYLCGIYAHPQRTNMPVCRHYISPQTDVTSDHAQWFRLSIWKNTLVCFPVEG